MTRILPQLSIIIPTLNSQSVIIDCLESIVNQTFKNYEVLIMDGGSVDSTIDIVQAYYQRSPNIKWFSEKDKGIYDAMNKGVKRANGSVLLFLGSDDSLFSDKVLEEVLFDSLELADLTYGDVLFKNARITYSGESSLEKLRDDQISICHQAIFYSKRTFEIIGYYNQKYFIHADYDFNIRCFENTLLTKKYIDKIITLYNETGVSSTHSNADHFHDDLTLQYINRNSSLYPFFNEHKKLKIELDQLKSSKVFRFSKFIKSTLFLLKRTITAFPLKSIE